MKQRLGHAAWLGGCAALLTFGPAIAAGPPVLERAALITPRATRSVLLDIARAGTSIVAVGERGIALWSDDEGASWHQAAVPVSVTLTSVVFPTTREGWAVGHGGVILHSADGGRSWALQLDGVRAARLALGAVPNVDSAARHQAQRLVDDGPDKPFLAVHFDDARNGIAVGAYGLAFVTDDGGASWTPAMDRIDNPNGLHLYSIARAGDATFIAGEQGLLLRSAARNDAFRRLPSPYEGSWFSIAADATGRVIAAGMLGHAFSSVDGGTNWQRIDTGTDASFVTSLRLAQGQWLLVDASGGIFSSSDGHAFSALELVGKRPLADVVQDSSGRLIGVGPRGVTTLQPLSGQRGGQR